MRKQKVRGPSVSSSQCAQRTPAGSQIVQCCCTAAQAAYSTAAAHYCSKANDCQWQQLAACRHGSALAVCSAWRDSRSCTAVHLTLDSKNRHTTFAWRACLAEVKHVQNTPTASTHLDQHVQIWLAAVILLLSTVKQITRSCTNPLACVNVSLVTTAAAMLNMQHALNPIVSRSTILLCVSLLSNVERHVMNRGANKLGWTLNRQCCNKECHRRHNLRATAQKR